jgi:hypothetical protein
VVTGSMAKSNHVRLRVHPKLLWRAAHEYTHQAQSPVRPWAAALRLQQG